MAIEIRPTPSLRGEEAKRFLKEISSAQKSKIDFRAESEKARKILEKSRNNN